MKQNPLMHLVFGVALLGLAPSVQAIDPGAIQRAAKAKKAAGKDDKPAKNAGSGVLSAIQNLFSTEAGKALGAKVVRMAAGVAAQINENGGYRFDGKSDSYGFVRSTWDPLLAAMKEPPLPTADFPSAQWAAISSWKELRPGDVVSSHSGHKWGYDWSGALFMGMSGDGFPMVWRFSLPQKAQMQPVAMELQVQPAPQGEFGFYYLRTHQLLSDPSRELRPALKAALQTPIPIVY